jgi:hypothetical protein
MGLLKGCVCVVVGCVSLCAHGDNILWDFQDAEGRFTKAAVLADYVTLGVTEDLSGSTVSIVDDYDNAINFDVITDGLITLTFLSSVNPVSGSFSYNQSNGLMTDYLYKWRGASPNAEEIQLSGLSHVLTPNTTYSFYLFGGGDKPNQSATFTFNGETKVTSEEDPQLGLSSNVMVKFSFRTGESSVADTLNFTWDLTGSNKNTTFNGFAIVAVPESSPVKLYGFLAIVLSAVAFLVYRRSAKRRKHAD